MVSTRLQNMDRTLYLLAVYFDKFCYRDYWEKLLLIGSTDFGFCCLEMFVGPIEFCNNILLSES